MRLLSRSDVARLLSFDDYVQAVEEAFRLHAQGRSLTPHLMHVDAPGGEFHVKGGGLFLDRGYFALKANGSFFGNAVSHGLPAIQGAILLFDATTGTPLALLESGEITVQRTGAATAVAARWLARPDSRVATICGCGRQGHVQLAALRHVLPIECVHAWDANVAAAESVAATAASAGLVAHVADDLASAVASSDVVVTCTPSRRPFVARAWLRAGTFVAAIGADSPGKQELDADVLAPPTRVVVDLLSQASHVGELQHALAQRLVTAPAALTELGAIVSGQAPGRRSSDEVIVFDATGTALQDVAAAAMAFRRAVAEDVGTEWQRA